MKNSNLLFLINLTYNEVKIVDDNNEEINKILDESIKVKEIILKYYDENGVWKME